MFKKIILSLILLSNLIFAKNDIDEFGQLVDKEGYVKPEQYMNSFCEYRRYNGGLPDKDTIRYWAKRDESKHWDNLRQLKEWKKKWEDAGYGNQWAIDSEGYINPKVYEDPLKKLSFYEPDKDRYWDQYFKLIRWGKVWEEKNSKK